MAKRVYFAFHYQDVVDFRANVVRNHGQTKEIERAGYYDASIWEESKKKSDIAIKRMINAELQYTSVTVVLIGSQTFARRWVRYEIMKSVERRNMMFGIHINSIIGKDGKTKPLGPNPFNYLGIVVNKDGKTGTPYEFDGTQWIPYSDLFPFTIPQLPTSYHGRFYQLSHWFFVKNWVNDNGFYNFTNWIN